MATNLALRSTVPLAGRFSRAISNRRPVTLSKTVAATKQGDSYEVKLLRVIASSATRLPYPATALQQASCVQKTEQQARNRQGVEPYGERKSQVDDVLTSPEANRDKEILGTEVGVADAMRFQGAAPELINSRYAPA